MERIDPPAAGESGPKRNRKDRLPATAVSLSDLDKAQRRRALAYSGVIIVSSWVFIFGAFFALPIGHESGLRAVVRLGVDIALIGAVFAWQIRRIAFAELPELRAVEALGVVIALFLVLFSAIYLSLSHGNVRTFSEPLDHVRAIYLTITIFSTVGFGDITPRTDGARLLVSVQMLLDLAIIGIVVRLLFSAAKSRITPNAGSATADHRQS
jgi:voltage-gated potassium channel